MSSTSSHSQTSAHKTSIIGMLQVVLAAVCWGTLGVFTTYLHQLGFTGWQITTLRVVTAAVLILAMLPWLWQPLKQLSVKQWLQLSLQSLIGVLGMTLCYFVAVLYSGAAMAVALLYTAPIFSLILAHFVLHEKMTKQSTLLAVMAVVGVALTMSGKTGGMNIGVFIGLLSGVCYSMYGILGKKAMHDKQSPQLVFFTSVLVSALVLMLVPSTYNTYHVMLSVDVKTWGYVFGLSLLGTIVPFWLYMRALQKLPATNAAIFTIFEPLTAIALAVLMLNQPLAGMQAVGVVLIICSALINALLGVVGIGKKDAKSPVKASKN